MAFARYCLILINFFVQPSVKIAGTFKRKQLKATFIFSSFSFVIIKTFCNFAINHWHYDFSGSRW